MSGRVRISESAEFPNMVKVEAATFEDLFAVFPVMTYMQQDDPDFPFWSLVPRSSIESSER
jgi:hypothetical protein